MDVRTHLIGKGIRNALEYLRVRVWRNGGSVARKAEGKGTERRKWLPFEQGTKGRNSVIVPTECEQFSV